MDHVLKALPAALTLVRIVAKSQKVLAFNLSEMRDPETGIPFDKEFLKVFAVHLQQAIAMDVPQSICECTLVDLGAPRDEDRNIESDWFFHLVPKLKAPNVEQHNPAG